MLIVDANVLVNAVNADARDHEPARAWLTASLGGTEAIGVAWVVALAFLRLTTHPAVFPRPLDADTAGATLERWLDAPPVVAVEPTPRHVPVLRGLLAAAGTAGNLVNDAHLAALALEHAATVVTFDRDFGRFEGVRWHVPGG